MCFWGYHLVLLLMMKLWRTGHTDDDAHDDDRVDVVVLSHSFRVNRCGIHHASRCFTSMME